MYLAPLRWLDLAIINFHKNRMWLRALLERPLAGALVRVVVVATLLGWLLIGLLASNSGEDALADFIRQQLSHLSPP